MRKILFVLIFALFAIASWAQSYRFVADYSSFRVNRGYGWSDWSDWYDCGTIVITFDLKEAIIRIYSQETQDYIIVEDLGGDYVDGGEMTSVIAVNSEGHRCKIDLVYYHHKRSHLYVRYNDIEFGYLIK